MEWWCKCKWYSFEELFIPAEKLENSADISKAKAWSLTFHFSSLLTNQKTVHWVFVTNDHLTTTSRSVDFQSVIKGSNTLSTHSSTAYSQGWAATLIFISNGRCFCCFFSRITTGLVSDRFLFLPFLCQAVLKQNLSLKYFTIEDI